MILEYKGQKKNLTEWAKIVGLAESTLKRRLNAGMSVAECLTTPAQSSNQHAGKKATVSKKPATGKKPVKTVKAVEAVKAPSTKAPMPKTSKLKDTDTSILNWVKEPPKSAVKKVRTEIADRIAKDARDMAFWLDGTFEVLCGYEKPRSIKVRGEVKGRWGVHHRPYGKSSLIHIPSGKKVSKNSGGISDDDLKELADVLDPLFKGNSVPTQIAELRKLISVVNDFYADKLGDGEVDGQSAEQ